MCVPQQDENLWITAFEVTAATVVTALPQGSFVSDLDVTGGVSDATGQRPLQQVVGMNYVAIFPNAKRSVPRLNRRQLSATDGL